MVRRNSDNTISYPVYFEPILRLEYFRKESNPNDPFHNRATKPAPFQATDGSSDASVFLLDVGKDYLIHCDLRSYSPIPFRLQRISRMSVSISDGVVVEMPFRELSNEAERYQCVALLDLKKLKSKKVVGIAKKSKNVESRTVVLEVLIEVAFEEGQTSLKEQIHCEAFPPGFKFKNRFPWQRQTRSIQPKRAS